MELSEQIKDLQSLEIRQKIRVWEPFMRKYCCNVIAEIGISKGHNFSQLIRHNPTIAVAVDAWRDDGVRSRNDAGFSQDELDEQYLNFKNEIADKPFVKIYREYSFDAVEHFEDEIFDMVYIDADHTYEGCIQDIKNWYPKVKKGGVLAGDDYRISTYWPGVVFGVIEAVNKFVKDTNLQRSFFELPRYGWGIIKPKL